MEKWDRRQCIQFDARSRNHAGYRVHHVLIEKFGSDDASSRSREVIEQHVRPPLARRMCWFNAVAVSRTRCGFGCNVLRQRHLRRNDFQLCIRKPADHLSKVIARQPLHNEMREAMVHSLSNYLRQRNASWSKET